MSKIQKFMAVLAVILLATILSVEVFTNSANADPVFVYDENNVLLKVKVSEEGSPSTLSTDDDYIVYEDIVVTGPQVVTTPRVVYTITVSFLENAPDADFYSVNVQLPETTVQSVKQCTGYNCVDQFPLPDVTVPFGELFAGGIRYGTDYANFAKWTIPGDEYRAAGSPSEIEAQFGVDIADSVVEGSSILLTSYFATSAGNTPEYPYFHEIWNYIGQPLAPEKWIYTCFGQICNTQTDYFVYLPLAIK